MNMSHCHTVVIGGGPAGCTAAAELAAAGVEVILLEKERLPRHKCCANGLTRNALALLPDGIKNLVRREVHTLVVESLDRDSITWTCPEPFMYTAPRTEVDWFLWRHAIAAGATAHEGTEVTEVEQEEDGVTVTTSEQTIHARYVVAADGARGRITRLLGYGPAGHIAAGIALDVTGDRVRQTAVESAAKLILGLGTGVYGWVFPQGEGSSIGIEIHWGTKDVDIKLAALLESEGYTWSHVVRRSAHPIPSLPGSHGLGTGRVLVAGDAAALAHPLTGEGVRYAALSGKLAARAILDEQSENPAQAYSHLVHQEILPDLHAGADLLKTVTGKERFATTVARHNRRIYDTFQMLLAGDTTFSRATDHLGGLGRIAAFLSGAIR
ncbi:MAG: NAD(P)/FAD-dependent oxidoreductase [Chloroflexota bacterium]